MKRIGIFLVILIIVIGTLILTRNILAQAIIVNGVKSITGLDLGVRQVNIGMLRTFSLRGLEIFNPAGFEDKLMADFPEIHADYNLGEFFRGKIHFNELRVELKELNVIINKGGQVNIKSLKALLPVQGGGKPPEVKIDNLSLKIGKVVFKDYLSREPNMREFNVNIKENFRDITDPNALVDLILVKALSKTDIASFANIDLEGLKKKVAQEVSSAAETGMRKVEEKVSETLDNIFKPAP